MVILNPGFTLESPEHSWSGLEVGSGFIGLEWDTGIDMPLNPLSTPAPQGNSDVLQWLRTTALED